MTVRALANRIGVSHVMVSEIELGRRPCPSRLRRPIAEALGIAVEHVQGRPPFRVHLDGLSEADRERVEQFVAELRARAAA